MIGNHVNTAAKLGKNSKITVKLHIKNSVMAIFSYGHNGAGCYRR